MTAPDLSPVEAATVARFERTEAVTEASVERDAIVAWLRRAVAYWVSCPAPDFESEIARNVTIESLRQIIGGIQRGEHHA